MNERAFTELYRSVQLRRFLWAAARRYFGKDEDLQDDAVAEAWKRILAAPAGQDFDEYKKHGARAIVGLYNRERRRRQKEFAADLDEPGEALRALTKKSLNGDW